MENLRQAAETFLEALEQSRIHADVALAAVIRAHVEQHSQALAEHGVTVGPEGPITYALRRHYGLDTSLDLTPTGRRLWS
jgi:hypothetical protein